MQGWLRFGRFSRATGLRTDSEMAQSHHRAILLSNPVGTSQRHRSGIPDFVTPVYDSATVTFDRIALATGILCIECKACGRRSALTRKNYKQTLAGQQTLGPIGHVPVQQSVLRLD